MNEKKAYLRNSNIELEIRGYKNKVNSKGVVCRIAECYTKAFNSIEDIPLDRIEIR